MAIDGANLVNSNVVYNTDRSMGTYQKALQQQQLKAQQAQKALADDLSSVKADGIRQADIPLYNQKFTKWQDMSIQASKERDPQKRLLLQSEASKSKNDLLNTVYRSKQEEKARTGIKTHYIGKDPYDDYEEGDWNKFMASEKLSIEDPNYIGDVTQFQLRPDTDTFLKDLNSVNNELLKSKGVYQNTVGKRVTSGNKTGTIFEQVKSVDPKVQAETYATYLATNRKAYKAVQALYPDLATQLPKQQFIEQVAVELAKTNPIRNTDAPRYEWDYKPTKTSGNGDDKAQKAFDIGDITPELTVNYGNSNLKAYNSVALNQPVQRTAGTFRMQDSKGKWKTFGGTTNEFKVINVARVPVANKTDTKTGLQKGDNLTPKYAEDHPDMVDYVEKAIVRAVSPIQAKGIDLGEDFFADPKDVLSTTSLTNIERNAITEARNSFNKPKKQDKPSQGKSYSTKYGSFTEQQLKDTYGDAWKQALDKIKK